MPRRPVVPSRFEDRHGNNIAFACPVCGKVYIVSGLLDQNGRKCPACHQSTGRVSLDGTTTEIEWPDPPE